MKCFTLTLLTCSIFLGTNAYAEEQMQPKLTIKQRFFAKAMHLSSPTALMPLVEQVDPTPLFIMLNEVYPIIEGVVPTEEEVAFIMAMLEPYIQNLETIDSASLQDVLIIGYEKLIRLFYSNQLTLGHKAALYSMMMIFANNLAT